MQLYHLQIQFTCQSVKLCRFMFVDDVNVAELDERLVEADEQISREDSQLTYWKQVRDKGLDENDKTIHLLEQELIDMEASFTEISSTTTVFVWLLN